MANASVFLTTHIAIADWQIYKSAVMKKIHSLCHAPSFNPLIFLSTYIIQYYLCHKQMHQRVTKWWHLYKVLICNNKQLNWLDACLNSALCYGVQLLYFPFLLSFLFKMLWRYNTTVYCTYMSSAISNVAFACYIVSNLRDLFCLTLMPFGQSSAFLKYHCSKWSNEECYLHSWSKSITRCLLAVVVMMLVVIDKYAYINL